MCILPILLLWEALTMLRIYVSWLFKINPKTCGCETSYYAIKQSKTNVRFQNEN